MYSISQHKEDAKIPTIRFPPWFLQQVLMIALATHRPLAASSMMPSDSVS
jgi:hypothetical protein